MSEDHQEVEYWRFNIFHRFTHVLIMISFFGSALTGMALKYYRTGWASWLIRVTGGVPVFGLLHRFCAIVIAGWVLMHLLYILYVVIVLRRAPWGSQTTVPVPKDLVDLWQSLKYFVGLGQPPQFERFTYFEKFDYLAVFWGVPVIGLSGLVLWFPELATRFLPGIAINIAHIMHSDEAVLAVGFIFVVHMYNTHLQPRKFPLNKVIFTGKVTAEEIKEDHPLEWKRLQEEPALEQELRVR